jgi:hypothetical protein
MKTGILSIFTLLLLLIIAKAEESPIKTDVEIAFEKSVLLKIIPPCTIKGYGSKLTVTPQNITFAVFIDSVTWGIGMPKYLEGAAQDSKNFNFDLTQLTTFKKEMLVKVKRTTMTETIDGHIIVKSGSRLPEILGQAKVKKPMLNEQHSNGSK